MKKIELDDNLFLELEKLAEGFDDTPSKVIRRLIEERYQMIPNSQKPETASTEKQVNDNTSPLLEFIYSYEYKSMPTAISRYLAILSKLCEISPTQFSRFNGLSIRNRIYIADQKSSIEQSGNSTQPVRVPETGYFALTNMDNPRKEKILRNILPAFGFSVGQINDIVKSIA